MKPYSLGLLFFSFLICFACQSTTESNTETEETTATPKEAAPAAAPTASLPSSAKELCACFLEMNKLEKATQEAYKGGDEDAYTKADPTLRQLRRDAKDCSRPYVDPIREDKQKVNELTGLLNRECPSYSSAIILMTKITFELTE